MPTPSLSTPTLSSTPAPRKTHYCIDSEPEKTRLLRIAYRYRDKWGKISNLKFWDIVATEIATQTSTPKKQHIGRNVNTMIKARREELLAIGSGEQPAMTSYSEAIDVWIEVVDVHNDERALIKEVKGKKDSESQLSSVWRAN